MSSDCSQTFSSHEELGIMLREKFPAEHWTDILQPHILQQLTLTTAHHCLAGWGRSPLPPYQTSRETYRQTDQQSYAVSLRSIDSTEHCTARHTRESREREMLDRREKYYRYRKMTFTVRSEEPPARWGLSSVLSLTIVNKIISSLLFPCKQQLCRSTSPSKHSDLDAGRANTYFKF